MCDTCGCSDNDYIASTDWKGDATQDDNDTDAYDAQADELAYEENIDDSDDSTTDWR